MDTQTFIIGFSIVAGVAIWITQLRSILSIPKENFRYEENKIIWAVVIIALGVTCPL